MGLLDGLLGNAAEISPKDALEKFGPILGQEEVVEKAYKLVRDHIIFTDKRLILINKQGITGAKVEYQSIPYKSVSRFAVETAGHFDLDAELKIWVTGRPEPIEQQFTRHVNIYDVQSLLAYYVAR